MEASAIAQAAPPPRHRGLVTLFHRRDQFYAMEVDRTPWVRPSATLRILLVADGALDFSRRDSELHLLVDTLTTMPGVHVRFELTVAHRDEVPDRTVMAGERGVARSITGFRFDAPEHFMPAMYDEVWLFGSSPLDPGELRALRAFINERGGLLLKEPRTLCPLLPPASSSFS